jgi:hypothetical protein
VTSGFRAGDVAALVMSLPLVTSLPLVMLVPRIYRINRIQSGRVISDGCGMDRAAWGA